MIEAKIYDENGEQVEGYFWYDNDVEYVTRETIQRCNDENVGWNFIQLVVDYDGDETVVAEIDVNGEPVIFRDFV